jgi:hypothetical protein
MQFVGSGRLSCGEKAAGPAASGTKRPLNGCSRQTARFVDFIVILFPRKPRGMQTLPRRPPRIIAGPDVQPGPGRAAGIPLKNKPNAWGVEIAGLVGHNCHRRIKSSRRFGSVYKRDHSIKRVVVKQIPQNLNKSEWFSTTSGFITDVVSLADGCYKMMEKNTPNGRSRREYRLRFAYYNVSAQCLSVLL